jgi:hypothetical protein
VVESAAALRENGASRSTLVSDVESGAGLPEYGTSRSALVSHMVRDNGPGSGGFVYSIRRNDSLCSR